MTPNVANNFSHTHQHRVCVTLSNSSTQLKMLQMTFLAIIKGPCCLSKLQCMTPNGAFLKTYYQQGLLLVETVVHDSKSFKRLMTCPLVRREGCPFKLQSMTLSGPKPFFSYPLARGKCCPATLQCMTPNGSKQFFSS